MRAAPHGAGREPRARRAFDVAPAAAGEELL